MIIYADTSALVKLFLTEQDSDATRQMLQSAQILGTGLLTRAELGSALARGTRRGLLSERDAQEAKLRLHAAWPTWIRVAINEHVVAQAEVLAWEHKLRGYDAVHLAAALSWQEQLEHHLTLVTFDQELWDAALAEDMDVWPTQAPARR